MIECFRILINDFKIIYYHFTHTKSFYLNQSKEQSILNRRINIIICKILQDTLSYLTDNYEKINIIYGFLIAEDELGLIEYLDNLGAE